MHNDERGFSLAKIGIIIENRMVVMWYFKIF